MSLVRHTQWTVATRLFDVTALILDFGGVISRTLFETHLQTEQALGLKPGTLTWRGPFDPDSDELWRDMQADKITERDYWRLRTEQVAGLVGAQWTEMSQFVKAARGADPATVIRPEFHHALDRALDAGVRVALLSNELDLFYGAQFRIEMDFFKQFEVIHDATYTGILKPDRRAYLNCVAELGIEPAQAVFVDDQARNIHGAQQAGLRTVQFDVHNPADSYRQALKLLGIESESTQ